MSDAANSITVQLSVNKASFSASMAEAQRNLDKFANKSRQAGKASVSSTQAASAALRVMQGDMTNNIRAVERFIGNIPGVGNALKMAFPLVGGIALGGLLVSLGSKLADFIEKARSMPRAIQSGFDALNLSQKTTTDELILSTDKIQSAIDKINHMPNNGLKDAFDQQTVSADKFADSIVSANAKLQELLSKNNVGELAALLGMWGTVSTKGIQSTAKKYGQQIDDAAYDYANTDPGTKAHDDAKKRLTDLQNKQIADARSDLSMRESGTVPLGGTRLGVLSSLSPALVALVNNLPRPDQTSAMEEDKGILHTTLNAQKHQAAQDKNDAAQIAKQKADDAKAASDAAKQAAQERLRAMTADLETMKLQDNLSVKQVYDYWTEMKSQFSVGSAAYNDVVAKQTQLAVEGAKTAHEAIAKAITEAQRNSMDSATAGPALINQSAKFLHGQAVMAGRGTTEGYLDSNADAIDQARNEAREKEADLNERVGKSITQMAAAQELANIHTKEYVTIQTALQGILDARIAEDKENPTAQSARAVTMAKAGVANAATQRDIQMSQDQQNINPAFGTAAIGAADALNDFVNASRDAAGMMRDIVSNTLGGLNEQIVAAMSGQRTHFKDFGAGVFRGVAGMGLQKAEGSVLGALGFGGKMGTKGNPMYVTMESGGVSAATSAVSSSMPKTGVGGFFGGLLKSFLPHFANGGQINGPALVGENGPEIWSPPSAGGTIIPNSKLSSSSSSSGVSPTIHIDARGSNDPAQTEAAVHRAMGQYIPHIVSASVRANSDQRMRKPSSVR